MRLISILRGLKEKYELHHGVRITDAAIVASATLGDRYISDRFLPDKAIDLMDEAASRLRMQVDSKPEELDEIDRRVKEVLELVRLPGQEDKMPSDLSGGMRKRVALARAVVQSPCCVLYDEPHAGLDPVTGDSIDHLIKHLAHDLGITNVIITHEIRSVFRIADRVVFMKDGQVYWEGPPAELKASKDPVLVNFIEGRAEDSDL